MGVPYFITFRTYGSWLHGEREGGVDKDTNFPGTAFLPKDAARYEREASLMTDLPVVLSDRERVVIMCTIGQVCRHRDWRLYAINVRTNHVHVVVQTRVIAHTAERAMNDFKAWATRRLVEGGLRGREDRVWSYHGSTRYLNTARSVARACQYTLAEQEESEADVRMWEEAVRVCGERWA